MQAVDDHGRGLAAEYLVKADGTEMTLYTWEEIQSDWLAGGTLTSSHQEMVTSFNRVADKFGREWIEASRTNNGAVSRGAQPTLQIASLGLMLQVLDQASDPSDLIQNIRNRRDDVWAELCAAYLLCSDKPDISIEYEPEIIVGARNRKCDLGVRSVDEPWTYVEVTVASRNSAAQKAILRSLERLASLITECAGDYALEVYLKREPEEAELTLIEAQIRETHLSAGQAEVELPSGLGTLYWNQHPPGVVALDNHGEPYRPGLAVVKAAIIDGEHRHIAVRWPYTDMRAEDMLTAEARQLPTGGPGLIMIQVSGAVGAMRAWRAIIANRFQPSMHTRVSAVCLFRSSIRSSEAGDYWLPECQIILNPHARVPLAAWIVNQLERFPARDNNIG